MKKILLGFITLGVMTGCSGTIDWREQLDKMAIVRPDSQSAQECRDIVKESFQCPKNSSKAYYLGEINLTSNVTRLGIRCE